MRTRSEIEQDGTRKDVLLLEVILDIRDLLNKTPVPLNKEPVIKPELEKKLYIGKPRGRSKKIK